MIVEATSKAVAVHAGTDRFKQDGMMIWGLIPLAIKVSGKDTNGQVLLFEHREMGKGGPPRHVHFDQDEWFYVLQGNYAFEIGDEDFRLKAGDSIFAPRGVPHGWANVGEGPGTVLTMVSPVGKFEKFILDTTKQPTLPSPEEIDRAFSEHGMKVIGPPLDV